jgi:MFS family permease
MIAMAMTHEPPRPPRPVAAPGPSAPVPAALKRALVPITLFAVANATDAFVLVKAARLGAAPVLLPMLWLTMHAVKASTATAGGRLADTYGKRNALALGWTVYALTWSAVGVASSVPVLFGLVALYGTSHGLVEGAEKALVAELADGQGRGAAFGTYNLLIGVAALAASVLFGVVWDAWGDRVAFLGAGGLALIAAALLMVLVAPARGDTSSR